MFRPMRYNVNLCHFAYAMGKPTSNVLFWASTVIDDGVSKRLTLNKGLNVVRCVVINGGGAMDSSLKRMRR